MQLGAREVLMAIGLFLTVLAFLGSVVAVYIALATRVTRIEERVITLEDLAKEQRKTSADVIRLQETVTGIDDKVCGIDERVRSMEDTVRGGFDRVVAEVKKLAPHGA